MGEFDDPFPGSWAVAAGMLTRWELRHNFERVYPDVYVRKGAKLDARRRAQAAAHWAKGQAVTVGFSAAALHGTKWIDDWRPAELAMPRHTRTPPGIILHRDVLAEDDICTIAEMLTTTPARTAFDLGRRLRYHDAIVNVDALCNATELKTLEVAELAERHSGARGLVQLRKVLDLVDSGAESPQETRTRLLIVEDGLPRPTTQIRVRDRYGALIARLDLGWEQWKVAVEYDGEQHWTDPEQREWDIDRTAILESLGWEIVRVGAKLLRNRPHVAVERIRRALVAAGAPM